MTTKHYTQAPGKLDEAQRANKEAVIETKKGTIRFKLLADAAPLTVSNFIFLANDHFYDALTFHRVESGFVVQGGDPNGNGTGGPGYTFADEPVTRAYTRGIVAMANSGPNTNGSQFFIVLADTPLPPQYTIFGEVTEGMETVDAIAIGDEMTTVIIRDTQ
ncbi:peptidylprolyl isomerase [Candidatus Berkelbacteria bacterium]|nr:peptidylprolyl isomerase [Candidatus Berkelbacteria bacterium]